MKETIRYKQNSVEMVKRAENYTIIRKLKGEQREKETDDRKRQQSDRVVEAVTSVMASTRLLCKLNRGIY